MPDLSYSGIEEFTPAQQRFMRRLVDSHNNVSQQVNAAPVGSIPQPQAHTAASVVGGGGVIDVNLTDNSPQYRGLIHHVDVSKDASFSSFHTISSPSTSFRENVGSGKFYTRSYSQYPTSAPSPFLNHGMVDATGTTQPALQPGDNKVGFGEQPYTTPRPPIR